MWPIIYQSNRSPEVRGPEVRGVGAGLEKVHQPMRPPCRSRDAVKLLIAVKSRRRASLAESSADA
ncbi:hypothetical protein E2562_037824 [Oryza meyeriana var. granulata]|uniref:Uncharacterized protein n=1 Tax=Oryza meyeriana var. granulata TaxID=110450 RepID=A0A6G1C2T9_9ORYZ|nr:hypothetical protein E2562_037824 [Oryza meyeriana var. granulata]